MRYLRFALIGIPLIASTITAAPARLDGLAERLARTAKSLASSGYRGFVDRDHGNRRDVEALFLAQQFSAGASLFQQLVRDHRPESELRDSVAILTDQARASLNFGFGQRSWQDISRTLDEIARELNTSRRGGFDDSQPMNRVTGRMRWRGSVDDRVQIYLQGSNASSKTLSGNAVSNAVFDFTAPLPQRAVTVDLKKLKGRGSVEVIQQPSRDNDYTAVVEIFDSRGGSEDYEFEIIW